MSTYTKYVCGITKKEFSQKSHLDKHLKSEKYKLKEENFRLKLEDLTKVKLVKKYKTDDIDEIVDSMTKKVEVQNEDVLSIDSEEFEISINTKEAMKEIIHDIHNFLRNNGAGYGMNALKLFTLFYGLAKIEKNGHFKTTGLPNSCKFSNIRKKLKENCEIGYEYVNENVIRHIYENEKINRMLTCEIPESITGNILKNLVDKIHKLVKKEKELNFQLAGKIYEYFIGRDQTAISELGAYFTDRHITDYIYEHVLQPTLDDEDNVQTMVDMFGGSGGFTLGYLTYLIKKYPDIDWKTQLNNVYHYDMNLDVVKYAMLEFYCLTGYFPSDENLKTMNSFSENFKESKNKYKTFDYIVTNPPYGGDKIKKTEQESLLELIKSKLEEHFKTTYKVRNMKALSKKTIESKKDKAKLKQYDTIYSKLKSLDTEKRSKTVSLKSSSTRLQHFADEHKLDIKKFNDKESVSFLMLMVMLAKDGVAVGVLKEGVFFDKKYAFLREFCVKNYNVEMIVSIDAKQFENTTTKTSIIKLQNNGKTKKIKFYDLIVEKDDQDELVENEDGTLRVEKIKDRITKVYHKLISVGKYDDIMKANYSFNGKDYNKKEIVCGKGYELKKLGDICKFLEKSKRKASYGKSIGKYNFYTSSEKIKKCDVADYDEEGLIIGDGGVANIHMDNKFSCSDHNHVIKTEYNKYIYNFLNGKKEILENGFTGSVIKNLSRKYLSNLKIPIPKKESKIKSWTKKISKPYDLKNQKEKELNKLEKEVQDEIKRITEEEDCEEKELGDVCEIKSGKFKSSECRKTGLYPFYTGKALQPEGYSNKFCYDSEEYIILIKDGGGGKFVYGDQIGLGKVFLAKGKTGFTCHQLALEFKRNQLYYFHFLKSKKNEIMDLASYSTGLGTINRKDLNNFKIKIPKDKSIIKVFKPKFKKIESLKEEIEELDIEYKDYIQELVNEAMPPKLNKEIDFKEN
jgi:restriction endonuclease S subunit